jgi:putative DNA-invertase from lambdoid prophage Rac
VGTGGGASRGPASNDGSSPPREIDIVLVWRLDRWGRSVTDLFATLQELEHLGVGFVSLTEALDLATPAGRAMAGLLAIFADYPERAIMQSHNAKVAVWPAYQ